MNKNYLNANHVSVDFLKSHGAKFDRVKRSWFVYGDVPDELANLLPTESSPRIDMRGFSPACPICGSDMLIKLNRKDGTEFWGCSNYKFTKCSGLFDYDEGLAVIDENLSMAKGRIPSSDKRKIDYFEVRSLIMQNILFAKIVFDYDENLIVYWLESPNENLGGVTPKSLMLTVDGNLSVKAAMQNIYDDKFKNANK